MCVEFWTSEPPQTHWGGSFGHLTGLPSETLAGLYESGLAWRPRSAPGSLLLAPLTPHLMTVLSHPRGETQAISPHPHIRTSNQQTTCASALGRNWPNNAPRK